MVKTESPAPLRVLLATASAELRHLVRGHMHIDRIVEVVAHAEDATEVQSLALAHTPDAILLDAALPGSLESAGTLLHLTLRQCCLLVVEGAEWSERLIRWLHVGASDVLAAPVTADQIVSALIRACDAPHPVAAVPDDLKVTTAAPRILLVSKTDGAGERLTAVLRQRFDLHAVDQATDPRAAVAQAVLGQHTVALIDSDQFGRRAFDMAAQLRQHAPATCVVLLAARVDMDKLRLAAQSSVRDYLLKPPTLDSLGAALTRARMLSAALTRSPGVDQRAPETAAHTAVPLAAGPEASAGPIVTALTRRGQIFTIYSPGGGNGCTALACGLALALRQRDIRVALLDADLQFGNAAALLSLQTNITLDQVAARIAFIRWPEEELAQHPSGLHVLPAPASIVQGALVSVEALSRVVQRLREYYEVVVVDAPHALNEHSVRLLKLADHILVPVRAWDTQQRRVAALRELLSARGFPPDRLHLVHSGFGRAPGLEAAAVVNLDVLAAQLAAGDPPDLAALEELVERLL